MKREKKNSFARIVAQQMETIVITLDASTK